MGKRTGIVALVLSGVLSAGALALSGTALAQIGLPQPLGGALGNLRGVVNGVEGGVDATVHRATDLASDAAGLARQRLDRLDRFVRENRRSVELDAAGNPARKGELLLLDPDEGALAGARGAGFHLIEQGRVEGLDLPFARLAVPEGQHLAEAEKHLRLLLPGKTVTSDQLHFPSGAPPRGEVNPAVDAARRAPVRGGTVGIIDGGASPGAALSAPARFVQAGFAEGAPRPSQHAQAIVSLLAGAGTARVCVADVYGSDPAGGSALAIARALGWMQTRGVGVVSISLVGPANPLLARAVAAAEARGMLVVAAVGNDGAAAPPAYPASYDGVVAVTGIDGRGRVLFEAGRASHLDYAAPGADLSAVGLGGRRVDLRGTSFAAPLVAARLAALRQSAPTQTATHTATLAAADAEATGASARTGRGVLCPDCRRGL